MDISYLSIDGEWKVRKVGDDVRSITISGEELLSIELIQFTQLPRLTKLSLNSNHLTTLKLSDLEDCKSLEHLDLSFNRIEFLDLTKLPKGIRKLDLSNNKISDLELSPLMWHQVETLKLSDNKIQTIELEPLRSCERLIRLDLAHNELRTLDFTPIGQSAALREIWLYTNKIKEIDLEPLRWLPTLAELRLERNHLQKIELHPLKHCQKLKTLYIESNPIQEVDISPLFNCRTLTQFSIDPNVNLTAIGNPDSIRKIPAGLASIIPRIQWIEVDDSSKLPTYVGNFIEPSGFHGYQLRVVNELNESMKSDCSLAAAMLCRKLLEGLLISIMKKRFGSTHPEYYLTKNKGFLDFKVILHKFWNVFDKDLKQWSPLQDQKRLREMRKILDNLRVTFNIDIHQDGLITTRKQLIESNLIEAVDFLKHIADHVQST